MNAIRNLKNKILTKIYVECIKLTLIHILGCKAISVRQGPCGFAGVEKLAACSPVTPPPEQQEGSKKLETQLRCFG